MERLSAEYLTLATLAQAERWEALLARSGLTEAQLEAVRASEAHGPLLASFRDAEARGLDVEATVPSPGGRPVPGRRRRRGGGAARPGGPLDPGGRWPAADRRQSHRRADPEGPRGQRPRDGPGIGRAGPCDGRASPRRGRPRNRERSQPGRNGSRELSSPIPPDGPAGSVKSRRSRPTGTAGTSPASEPSAARAT